MDLGTPSLHHSRANCETPAGDFEATLEFDFRGALGPLHSCVALFHGRFEPVASILFYSIPLQVISLETSVPGPSWPLPRMR